MEENQQNNVSTETSQNDDNNTIENESASDTNKHNIKHYEGLNSVEGVAFTIEEEKKALETIENALEAITLEQWGKIESGTSSYLDEKIIDELLESFEAINIADSDVKDVLTEKIKELTEKAKGLANNDNYKDKENPRDAQVRNSYAQALNNIDNSIEDFQKPPTPDQIEAFKEMLVDSELAIASSYYNRVVSILTHDQKEQLLNLYDEISNEENSDTPEELQNKKIILTSINKKIAELAEEYEDNPDELESKIEELFVPTNEITDDEQEPETFEQILENLVDNINLSQEELLAKLKEDNSEKGVKKGLKFLHSIIGKPAWFLRLYFTLLEKSGVIGDNGSLISKNDPAYKIIAAMVGKKGYAPEFETGKTDKQGNPIKKTFQIDNWNSIIGALEYNSASMALSNLTDSEKREVYGVRSILFDPDTKANLKKYKKDIKGEEANLNYEKDKLKNLYITLMKQYKNIENDSGMDDETKRVRLQEILDQIISITKEVDNINEQKENIQSKIISITKQVDNINEQKENIQSAILSDAA